MGISLNISISSAFSLILMCRLGMTNLSGLGMRNPPEVKVWQKLIVEEGFAVRMLHRNEGFRKEQLLRKTTGNDSIHYNW